MSSSGSSHSWSVSQSSFDQRAYKSLLKALRKLPAEEQRIVQVLAVVCQPILQTELQSLLSSMVRKAPQDERWHGLPERVGKTLREKLLDLELLQRQQNRLIVHPLLLQTLSRQAVEQGFYAAVAEAVGLRWPPSNRRSAHSGSVDPQLRRRRIQHAFYCERYDELFELLGIDVRFSLVDPEVSAPLIDICFGPFDEQYLAGLPADVIFQVLAPQLCRAGLGLAPVGELSAVWLRLCEQGLLPNVDGVHLVRVEQLLYRGRLAEAQALLAGGEGWLVQGQRCWLHCLQGDFAAAISCYQQGLVLMRKATGKRNDFMPGMPAVCYLLALLQARDREHFALAQKFVRLVDRSDDQDQLTWVLRLLGDVLGILQGRLHVEDSHLLHQGTFRGLYPFVELFRLLAYWWLETMPIGGLSKLAQYTRAAQKAGWDWYAREGALLLEALGKPLGGEPLQRIVDSVGGVGLTALIQPIPAWQRSLLALQDLADDPCAQTGAGSDRTSRLVWLFDLALERGGLQPREQKMTKSGRWSKGRAVALKRLAEEASEQDFLSDQDRRIAACIHRDDGWGYYGGSYLLDPESSLRAAVGHPLLFWAHDMSTTVELVAAEPELQVQQRDRQLLLRMYPFHGETSDDEWQPARVNLIKESEYRVRLVQFSAQHLRIGEILGEQGLTVPVEAKEQVLASINAIAPLLTVHSDIGGSQVGARAVEADARPHIHLLPAGSGLRLEWYVRPFARAIAEDDARTTAAEGDTGTANAQAPGTDPTASGAEPDGGPMFRPGEGGATVFAEIAGEKLQTTRALDAERQSAAQLLEGCHIFASLDDGECALDDPEMALEALLRLQESEHDCVLAWPRGQKIRLNRETGLEQMQLSVKKERDWFALDGQLQLDEERVLAMGQLMSLLQASPGRFVRLGGGEVLALTEELRRRLQSLAAYSHGGRVHPLASEALDEAMQGMAVKTSQAWRAQLERLDSVRQLEPVLPSTLQAELRDYQVEGYAWLARLAQWGAGACLADDMGLGKTVQALALIVERANGGPTLILAPTSVGMNWLDEAQRFAPTLRMARFGERADRQDQLDQLRAFDVLVCSYGLLQSEGERLAEIDWHTIVADEAQAFKNAATKRSQAVMALRGDFKMITTGTPIENHLGELWNLFRFINPGLLGSLAQFNERFATPIEVHNSREAKLQLRRLIRPFILRRLKSDVLTELPPRTEVTLHVELDEEERVFYEAARREAVRRIAESSEQDHPGQQRVKMLVEIMRLRRACCHPRLVMPESTIGSAKLKAFGSVLRELLDSHHKALVFSQFVGHLELLREYLEQQRISYQYLDGSTPAKQRKRAVDAFQNGEGDVFLISLKAGGAGLNLTAADYVIHMDPWWNPAVEDQASDRAHRMGQQRPVTIYRIVAKDTIEDKIVGLHEQKRDLADSLLEGSEMSGKMSVDEMVALIKEV